MKTKHKLRYLELAVEIQKHMLERNGKVLSVDSIFNILISMEYRAVTKDDFIESVK